MAVNRRDDVLERREGFALAADQDVAVLAGEVDADAVRHVLRGGLEVEVHRVDDFLDEFGDIGSSHKLGASGASVPCAGVYLTAGRAGAPIR